MMVKSLAHVSLSLTHTHTKFTNKKSEYGAPPQTLCITHNSQQPFLCTKFKEVHRSQKHCNTGPMLGADGASSFSDSPFQKSV